MSYLKINTSLNAGLRPIGASLKNIFHKHGIYTQPTKETFMLVPFLQNYDDRRVAAFLRDRQSESIDMQAMRGVKLSKGDREALDSFSSWEEASIICRVQQLIGIEIFHSESPTNDATEHMDL
jgi:hypothetical protein